MNFTQAIAIERTIVESQKLNHVILMTSLTKISLSHPTTATPALHQVAGRDYLKVVRLSPPDPEVPTEPHNCGPSDHSASGQLHPNFTFRGETLPEPKPQAGVWFY